MEPSPSNTHQTFLIASILATLAIIIAICASCHRKPKKATPLGEKIASLGPKPKAETQEAEKTEFQGSEEMLKSKRRLSISSSMGLEGKLAKIKTGRREKRKGEEEDNTVWKKTIIMGEKNKVPPWEEEEEEAMAMEKYGGDSYRRNYRPRSLPVSPIKWNEGDEVRSMEEV